MDETADDLGTDATDAKLALRAELLHDSTLFAIRVATSEPWPGTLIDWRTWVDWATTATARCDQIISQTSNDRDGTLPADRLLFGHLNELLGELTIAPRCDIETGLQTRYSDWLELLESLASASRRVESFGLIPMDETAIDHPGVDLLGTVQDSLILLAYGGETDQEFSADSVELHRLLAITIAAGGWEALDRASSVGVPADFPEPAGVPDWREQWREVLDFLRHASAAPGFHRHLDPANRVLTSRERDEVVVSLRAGAIAIRKLISISPSATLPTVNGYPTINLRTAVGILRRVQRSLILALSDRDDRRAQTMSVAELIDPACAVRSPGMHQLTHERI